MKSTTRRCFYPLLIAFLLLSAGCQQKAPASPSELTLVNTALGETVYESGMAFNIELLDPATGLPRHATTDELKPVVMREAHRLKQEPLLRQVLNKPRVQQTRWFKSFNGNLDDAYAGLLDGLAVYPIPNTSLIRVSLVIADRSDAQAILAAIGDEYMRIKDLDVEADTSQRLRAAQKSRNSAEERLASLQIQVKRFLQVQPIGTTDEQQSEEAMQIRMLSKSLIDLERRYRSVIDEREQQLKRQQEGAFEPSASEQIEISQSATVHAISHRLLELQLEEATLASKTEPDEEAIKQTAAHIQRLEQQRQAASDREFRMRFNAAIERSTLEAEILSNQIASTNEQLAEWRVRQQERFQALQEYNSLLSEMSFAEEERRHATQHISKLIMKTEAGANGLGYRVRVEYPAQKARERQLK
ncbi:MAG: hypothetical protein AAGI37_17375 [Planctomycetota bacterium]